MERSSPKSSMDDSLKEIPDNEKKEETAQEQEQEQDKEKEDKEEEEDEEEDNENEIMDTLTIGHAIPSAQSPFMARQAERAHMTGLSPIEEMRLAQNELRAKAATQFVRLIIIPQKQFVGLVTLRIYRVLKKKEQPLMFLSRLWTWSRR
jgi:LAS superfamily LD-carboxypeptidase LdcB